MNSSKNHPLHEVGQPWSVWYMPDMYNRQYFNGPTPTARNARKQEFNGVVVDSQWIDNSKHGEPYGWLVTIQLADGSYRSLYECKCCLISRNPVPLVKV